VPTLPRRSDREHHFGASGLPAGEVRNSRPRNPGKTNGEASELFKVGRRQLQRLVELTDLPEVLINALADESSHVDATKAVRLMQHARTDVPEPERLAWLATWIAWIDEEKATLEQLNAALRANLAKDKEAKPVTVFVLQERDGQKSLRLRPIRVDAGMCAEQRQKIVANLKEAVAFVDARLLGRPTLDVGRPTRSWTSPE